MFHVKHDSIRFFIIKNIKRGMGALYKLCAPSTITHYALRITH